MGTATSCLASRKEVSDVAQQAQRRRSEQTRDVFDRRQEVGSCAHSARVSITLTPVASQARCRSLQPSATAQPLRSNPLVPSHSDTEQPAGNPNVGGHSAQSITEAMLVCANSMSSPGDCGLATELAQTPPAAARQASVITEANIAFLLQMAVDDVATCTNDDQSVLHARLESTVHQQPHSASPRDSSSLSIGERLDDLVFSSGAPCRRQQQSGSSGGTRGLRAGGGSRCGSSTGLAACHGSTHSETFQLTSSDGGSRKLRGSAQSIDHATYTPFGEGEAPHHRTATTTSTTASAFTTK